MTEVLHSNVKKNDNNDNKKGKKREFFFRLVNEEIPVYRRFVIVCPV